MFAIERRRYSSRTNPPLKSTISQNQYIINAKILNQTDGEIKAKLFRLKPIDSVSVRLQELIRRNEISQNWAGGDTGVARTEPYTIDEDVELMQWLVHGRFLIDAKIFHASSRATDLKARCDWLCEDRLLITEVARIEERARLAKMGLDWMTHDMDYTEHDVHSDLRVCVKISLTNRGGEGPMSSHGMLME